MARETIQIIEVMLGACSPGGSKRADAGKQARTAPKSHRKGARKEQRPYRVAEGVAKRTQNSLKNLTFGSLVFNVEFQRAVSRIEKAKVPEIIPEFSEKTHTVRSGLASAKKLRSDRACASGSRARPFRSTNKSKEKATCEPTHLR